MIFLCFLDYNTYQILFSIISQQQIENLEAMINIDIKNQNSKKPPPQQRFHVDIIIDTLKKIGCIPLAKLQQLIADASQVVQNQPNILKASSPITVVGDIHGQFFDLLNIFQKFGRPDMTKYIFLGDYVDRVLLFKLLYPKNFLLLRGNHEGRTMTTFFNFKLECQKKYNSNVYQLFLDFFSKLPLCAIIDNKYFAVHGGLSPSVKSIQQIEKIDRFVEIPDQGVLCDLLWSDPSDQNNENWVNNKMRSCSYFYSRNQSSKFLGSNSLRMIIRGHEVQMKGFKYQYSATNQPLTLTIFSAPRYCDTYKNKGAVAILNGKSMQIRSFKDVEHPFVLNNYLNAFQLSFPIITAQVNKVYAHILKAPKIRRSLKPLSSQDIAQMKKAIQNLQILQIFFNNHAAEIQNLVVSSKPQQHGQSSDDISTAQNIFFQLFQNIKFNDFAQKLPTIFGPKGIQFVKLHINSQEDEDPSE